MQSVRYTPESHLRSRRNFPYYAVASPNKFWKKMAGVDFAAGVALLSDEQAPGSTTALGLVARPPAPGRRIYGLLTHRSC